MNVPARFTVDDSAFQSSHGTQKDTRWGYFRVCFSDQIFLLNSESSYRDADRARYEWQAPGLLFNTNTLEVLLLWRV